MVVAVWFGCGRSVRFHATQAVSGSGQSAAIFVKSSWR